MSKIKGMERAQLGRETMPIERRTRSTTSRKGGDTGFVQIGAISAEIVRRLRRE